MLFDRKAPSGQWRVIAVRPFGNVSEDRYICDRGTPKAALKLAKKHNEKRDTMDDVYMVCDDQGNLVPETNP